MSAVAVNVAVAVLIRPDDSILLGQRPTTKVYGGYWEFPGGKIEPGESAREALVRELREELDIEVETAYPWLAQLFTYPHATVRLHFFRVTAWRGEPRALEHRALAWQLPRHLNLEPMLPANTPVLRALELPAEYAISDASRLGDAVFLARLEARLKNGLRLMQLREKSMDERRLACLAIEVAALAKTYGARLLINSDTAMAEALGADGVHLTSTQLSTLQSRPDLAWVAASCHTRAELDRAARLGMDFVVLGPVHPTDSHPRQPGIGWERLEPLAADYSLPVFAIGGLRPGDLLTAWTHGAHGIAMIRGSWSE